MFEEFFHLRENPFTLAPNPRFIFRSHEHNEALAHLRYWIENGEGFVLITGEVGTGKTTAIFDLMSQLSTEWAVAFVANSTLSESELLEEICRRFQIEIPAVASKPALLQRLEQHLSERSGRGLGSLLILDEAQNFESRLLEEIRLLSNLEQADGKLLQIALIGQPELERKLEQPELRQLRQRIGVRYRLNPLSEEETVNYVHHRLAVAGGDAHAILPMESGVEIHRLTHGIPREINIVTSQALISAFVEGASVVTRDHVRNVVLDFAWSSIMGRGPLPAAARGGELRPRTPHVEPETAPLREAPLAPPRDVPLVTPREAPLVTTREASLATPRMEAPPAPPRVEEAAAPPRMEAVPPPPRMETVPPPPRMETVPPPPRMETASTSRRAEVAPPSPRSEPTPPRAGAAPPLEVVRGRATAPPRVERAGETSSVGRGPSTRSEVEREDARSAQPQMRAAREHRVWIDSLTEPEDVGRSRRAIILWLVAVLVLIAGGAFLWSQRTELGLAPARKTEPPRPRGQVETAPRPSAPIPAGEAALAPEKSAEVPPSPGASAPVQPSQIQAESKPPVTQPAATKPAPTKPAATKQTAKPAATKPAPTTRPATKPVATQPAPTRPAPGQPETIKPAGGQPPRTAPAPTAPSPSRPANPPPDAPPERPLPGPY